MKIVFLSRLYLPHIGGVEKHVQMVSRVLSRKHKIKIITEKYSADLKDYEVIEGIEVYRMPPGDKWQVWKWMRKNRYLLDWADVIHAHDVYFWIIPYRLRYWKKKTYVTFHGWEGRYPIPLKNKVVRKVSDWLARGNICVGDFISKWYGTEPDSVTYGAA